MKNNQTYKYYFIAGEASGDLHGAQLMRKIKTLNSNVSFFGIGGPRMQEQGLSSLVSIKKLAVLGFWEVLKNLFFFLKLKEQVINDILSIKPDKIILIDYPGFNLKIAQAIKQKQRTPIIYYISPQLWAWKENRINVIKKNIDKMIVLFPFEKEWYAKHNFKVIYLGHPLIELHSLFLKTYKQKKHSKHLTVALFPGSRQQELDRHLPLYKKTIKELNKQHPNIFYVIKLFNNTNLNIKESLGLTENFSIEQGSSFQAFHDSDFALVASGTATLEGAICNTPLAVIYKTSFFSWLLAKFFLKIRFISIVNILNEKKIVEEFLQNRAHPKIIAKHILNNASDNCFNYSPLLSSLNKKNIYYNSALEIMGVSNEAV